MPQPPNSDWAIQRIDHVAINVTDMPRARAFYGGVLKLKEVPRPKSFDFAGAWYRIGTVDLHLISRGDNDPQSRRHFAFWVSDVHAAAKSIQSAGHQVTWDTYKIEGLDRFFVRDPDGNRLEFQGNELAI
ncbi:MAG TPA: VOC family protein [Tepidisphaeraceae bacterium]|jgi:catechol 2,3-dioxygenase-like lactoylglutathione lyase family enzyme|nr:VOC family protein [Tepidisphaeraceae bacterium]